MTASHCRTYTCQTTGPDRHITTGDDLACDGYGRNDADSDLCPACTGTGRA